MSDVGIIASRFSSNSQSLKYFDEAIRYFRSTREVSGNGQAKKHIERILDVITPLSETIQEKLSESRAISEHGVISIIRKRNEKNWPSLRSRILRLESKLGSQHFQILDDDLELLNDIADALDSECTELFNRMSEGR
jgi:hypothetical protein